MVWTVHNSLRGDIRTAFADLLEPQLTALLQQLQPIQNERNEDRAMQQVQHNALISEFRQCQGNLQALQASNSTIQSMSDQRAKAIMARLEMQDVNMLAAIDVIKHHISTSTEEFIRQQGTSTSLSRRFALNQQQVQNIGTRNPPQGGCPTSQRNESLNKL